MSGDRRASRRWLIVAQAFLGVTAVAGAWGLLSGAIDMDVELLAGSPFDGYAVPALALLGVGVAALAAAALVARRERWAAEASAVSGLAIVIFELVEFAVIGFHVLQVVYGVVGLFILALAWQLRSVGVPATPPDRRV